MFGVERKYLRLLDLYFANAWLVDILLAVCVVVSTHFILRCIPSDESVNDSTSSIIDNSVSLAGFILAALTIIVSFRASVMSKLSDVGTTKERKRIEEQMNGLELLLASKNYHILTNVFKGTLKELLFTFALLGTVQLYREVIPDNIRFYSLQAGYVFTVLAIARALLILFKILAVEENQTTIDDN